MLGDCAGSGRGRRRRETRAPGRTRSVRRFSVGHSGFGKREATRAWNCAQMLPASTPDTYPGVGLERAGAARPRLAELGAVTPLPLSIGSRQGREGWGAHSEFRQKVPKPREGVCLARKLFKS